jgi:hypothetical protein
MIRRHSQDKLEVAGGQADGGHGASLSDSGPASEQTGVHSVVCGGCAHEL